MTPASRSSRSGKRLCQNVFVGVCHEYTEPIGIYFLDIRLHRSY